MVLALGGGCLPPPTLTAKNDPPDRFFTRLDPEDILIIWKLGGCHQAFDEAFEHVAAVIAAKGWVI